LAAPSPHPLGDPAALALVRRKARSLQGQAGLTSQDLEDVEQDLLLALLPRLKHHDPAQSPLGAFFRLLLNREADRLLRRRLAAKRRAGRTAPVDAVDPPRDTRTGTEPGRAEEDRDRESDVAAAVAGLPPELAALVEALRTDPTVAGAARALGRRRTTVHDQISRVRARLKDAGLLAHVQNPRHPAGEPGTQSGSRRPAANRTRRKT
jgi:DNA-directed RNA polymerase specialized sigma24 family protein